MNIARITELKDLICGWQALLSKLRTRKENLVREQTNSQDAQERIDYAVSSAQRRVAALAALGLRESFLEDIIRPVQNRPDCSGILTAVKNEINDTQSKIQQTSNQISTANQEKQLLETEGV